MSNLPEEYKAEIRGYIGIAANRIRKIESGEYQNGLVHNNDFLDPTVVAGRFPFNHTSGELYYYKKIREALEIGLERGAVPREYLPYLARAPPIIRSLLVTDNPETLG